jgi:large subunit ribosomal protein L31
MKEKIHPKYYQVEVRCACGNVIKTGSTKKEFSLAVCSNCHPFYTKSEKLLDSAGRVERFQKRFAWTGDKVQTEVSKPKSKAAKGVKPTERVESRARGNRVAKKAEGAPAGAAAESAAPAAESKPKAETKPEAKAEAKPETAPKAEAKPEAKKEAENK